ncbi:MAG: hypothetical protein KHZ05_09685 [Oscillospiraceae bacterium]|nr:hypothetical protein [Oscillospiraceae bacterium]
MDCETINWQAISAIGTFMGALATFAAVFVALFQTRIANRKKLKLTFGDNYSAINAQSGAKVGPFLYLSAVNTGNRDIVLQNWFICIGKSQNYLVKNNTHPLLQTKLPQKLCPEERADFFLMRDEFVEILKKDKIKSAIHNWQRVSAILVDNAGKKYIIRSKKRVSEYLKMDGENP